MGDPLRHLLQGGAQHMRWDVWRFLLKVFVCNFPTGTNDWPQDVAMHTFETIGFQWAQYGQPLMREFFASPNIAQRVNRGAIAGTVRIRTLGKGN